MNDLTKHLTGNYEAKQAIIVYNNQHSYYLECHEIVNGEMQEGKPLQKETIQDMVAYFANKQKEAAAIRGIIPENLLMCEWNETRKIMVWYNPPSKRFMHFTENLKINNGEAHQPGLLYVVNDYNLSIFALKCKGRPGNNEKLFIPPYHNCSAKNGDVCLGSAKAKKPKQVTYEAYIKYYETMFWSSEFSHLAAGDTPIKGNINMYWKKAIRTQQAFDTDVLLPMKPVTTLEKLINKICK